MTQTLLSTETGLAAVRQAEIQSAQRAEVLAKKDSIHNYDQIEEAAKEFESVFMAEMLKPMFAGIKPNPMFGGGQAEEIFQGMIVQEYGKIIAERGGIGIADSLKIELINIQEELQNGTR